MEGGKNRRRGKNESDHEKRELTFKEDGQDAFPPPLPIATEQTKPNQTKPPKRITANFPPSLSPTEYAQVVKMLGNGRLEAQCFDGVKRLANIRGKLRKKVWINQGDIILLSLREYQDDKGDVILKYTADEARSLKAYGELPESAKINETDTYGADGDGDCNFEFDDDRDSEESEDEGAAGGAGKKEVDIDDI
ncbi:translation initiation factor eIF-1A [Colletotrichum cuscutae]|uniref:Translation initiation factor eIF-1A n=1 Tax=Colletotrichum cuscutae TaxID=1209917 RepID=A0AAI9Y5U7_9PEZI|nr:translation initiation factor eIF-1A [Colletotrichum cuscutae]